MKKLVVLALLLTLVCTTKASIDTINVYSNSMFKNIRCVVVTPTQYNKGNDRWPVVYLLHGFGGSYSNWVRGVADMQQLADENRMMIVCPSGNTGSWYFDSPVDLTSNFETHISKEVPHAIDSLYRTMNDRRSRAISGLSMGGHGALFTAFRHASTFGACGSMSGALMVHRITRGYNMNKILGDTGTNKKYYTDWSAFNVIEKYPTDSLAIMIDCGIEDPILMMSKMVHDKMVTLKIPHDYVERPGKHDMAYWRNAVRYQMLFFRNYFDKNKKG